MAEGKVRRKRDIPTWTGAGRWPLSITSIFISGIWNGALRSGRPMPMRPFPYGCGSTVMSGLNGSWTKPGSAMKPWTTDSVVAATRLNCRRFAIGSVQPQCKAFSRIGHGICPRFSPRPTGEPDTGFRQFEISDTGVFDRPQAGRMWFEGVIRDHLDVGRPDQIALIFQRRVNGRTPGRFRTRVINQGVDPILCCYYKSSRIKQYFKEGRALRTEVVICDTADFGVGRRVCTQNWNALRAVGESANRCLCDDEAADAQPAPDVATFCRVTRPSTNKDGLYAAALRFGEQRVMAVLVGFGGC